MAGQYQLTLYRRVAYILCKQIAANNLMNGMTLIDMAWNGTEKWPSKDFLKVNCTSTSSGICTKLIGIVYPGYIVVGVKLSLKQLIGSFITITKCIASNHILYCVILNNFFVHITWGSFINCTIWFPLALCNSVPWNIVVISDRYFTFKLESLDFALLYDTLRFAPSVNKMYFCKLMMALAVLKEISLYCLRNTTVFPNTNNLWSGCRSVLLQNLLLVSVTFSILLNWGVRP